jgi:hypothetical protein
VWWPGSLTRCRADGANQSPGEPDKQLYAAEFAVHFGTHLLALIHGDPASEFGLIRDGRVAPAVGIGACRSACYGAPPRSGLVMIHSAGSRSLHTAPLALLRRQRSGPHRRVKGETCGMPLVSTSGFYEIKCARNGRSSCQFSNATRRAPSRVAVDQRAEQRAKVHREFGAVELLGAIRSPRTSPNSLGRGPGSTSSRGPGSTTGWPLRHVCQSIFLRKAGDRGNDQVVAWPLRAAAPPVE